MQEYVGGYEDWLRQRPSTVPSESAGRARAVDPAPSRPTSQPADAGPAKKRLSYHEQRELEQLPARIESLEAEHRELETRIAGPGFYKEGREAIQGVLARHEAVQQELQDCYARWDALDSRS